MSQVSSTKKNRTGFNLGEWLKQGLTPGTVLTLLTISGGFVATEARRDVRADETERRLAKIERLYVPRSEHDSKDELLREIREDFRVRLDHLEQRLDYLIARR